MDLVKVATGGRPKAVLPFSLGSHSVPCTPLKADKTDISVTFFGRGIGAALCSTVEDVARSRGIRTLYLFTLDKQAWFSRLGWPRPSSQALSGLHSEKFLLH
jgi:GNAT superfamily N-acetyltransferase